MAWHDNNWDGKVCQNPEGNTYCTGTHSLLSGRIEKRKDTEVEQNLKGQTIAENFDPKNVPPCYWSINAFSDTEFDVEHQHGFKWIKETIREKIRKNSVITWPFRLSFNHSKERQEKYGQYPPNLEKRIDEYIDKFNVNESIIFFYANYDNPVSGDDMKYLLLGCSVINTKPDKLHFNFSEKWLEDMRGKDKMQNFPTLNWMLQFSHDKDKAILLPYKEYVEYVENNQNSEDLLSDMKVLIEETSLISGFKYVSMDIDNDKCLYLLYKIRKSILKIKEHNQQVIKYDIENQEKKIEKLIQLTWNKRSKYPSLGKILDYFINDSDLTNNLSTEIQAIINNDYSIINFFEDIANQEINKKISSGRNELLDLGESRIFKKYYRSLGKLSLFELTENQIKRIIKNNSLLKEIEVNPYAIYEEYIADQDNLDYSSIQDEPIDVFKIDIGMIPDRKYIDKDRTVQNLVEDSPERIRSVIINYLWNISESGHCFDNTSEILKEIHNNPLIYKRNISIDDEAILNIEEEYKNHFIQKLYIEKQEKINFLYLKIVKNSELQINNICKKLLERTNHEYVQIDFESHIVKSLESEELKNTLKLEDEIEVFKTERRQLYKNIFQKSIFLLTGKPGAGKTFEASKIIEHLDNLNEDVLVLTPTGKASLRLSDNIRKNTKLKDFKAKTIDKFIFEKGFSWIYDDWEKAINIDESEKITVQNLVIDESSMIDLKKLSLLFSIIRFNDSFPKRVIFVGDENQLPPIGIGKPFHDLIEFFHIKKNLSESHYIHLTSNCRQENDINIIKLSEAFTDKTRCYEEAFKILDSGEGKKSDGLFVYNWKNKLDLNSKINRALIDLFKLEGLKIEPNAKDRMLNQLFGLYDNGHVNRQDENLVSLCLDKFQILTPYRTGFYGTLGLNKLIQKEYGKKDNKLNDNIFYHSDKILRLYNWYIGRGESRKLELSNGSIGIVTVHSNDPKRRYHFPDRESDNTYIDDEENFDLAYSITVHKSQGSDFKNVFLVIPDKKALLSKELIYTALTRSKFRLFIFVKESESNLLLYAKNNSHLIHRNTSLFSIPKDKKEKYCPDIGVSVSSRVEYIIYQALKKSGLNFKYEAPLKLENLNYKIHPDFTIYLKGDKTIYWEHLGMLDTKKYFNDWQIRKRNYFEHNLKENLISTDDLEGIKEEKIQDIIEDIINQNIKSTIGNKFSEHHYPLY